jgi:chemotaxis protein MotB
LKKKKDTSETGSSWLASYADLMTILFIVFVVLYALADINEDTWERFAEAMASRSAGGFMSALDPAGAGINELLGSGIIPLPDIPMSSFRPQTGGQGEGGPRSQMEEVAEQLQTYFGEIGMSNFVEVGVNEEGSQVVVSIGEGFGEDGTGLGPGMGPPGAPATDRPMFDSGSATIRREFLPVLQAIGQGIAIMPGVLVDIQGHTDNVPLRGGPFVDNWGLSSARALNVLRYFVQDLRVIEPSRISHTGHGEYRPIDTNDTAEGRQHNRRVEIILTYP